jgi:hypothetical protein
MKHANNAVSRLCRALQLSRIVGLKWADPLSGMISSK